MSQHIFHCTLLTMVLRSSRPIYVSVLTVMWGRSHVHLTIKVLIEVRMNRWMSYLKNHMYGYAFACDDYTGKHCYLATLLERKQVEDGYFIMWTIVFIEQIWFHCHWEMNSQCLHALKHPWDQLPPPPIHVNISRGHGSYTLQQNNAL